VAKSVNVELGSEVRSGEVRSKKARSRLARLVPLLLVAVCGE
jgi:hypothetical protein